MTPIASTLPQWEDVDWIGIDAGCLRIEEAGRVCHFAIGDFDSGKPQNPAYPLDIHPVEKNETDTQLALREAAAMGYTRIVVWGGLSGRLDHTIANLRTLAWECPQAELMDEMQKVSVLLEGSHEFRADYRHISFFALEPSILTLEGFDYPLCDQPVDQKDLYTTSNSISGKSARAIVKKGRLLCVQSRLA